MTLSTSTTTTLNAAITAHLRNQRPLTAISNFNASLPDLRNTTTYNLLLSAYTSLNRIHDALHLFDEMPTRDPVSYNTLISALARSPSPSGGALPAFRLFLRMLRSSVGPTGPTLSTVLSSLPDPKLAPQVHAVAIRSALNSNPFIGSALIAGYANLKDCESLYRSFDEIEIKNPVTWTCLVIGLMDLNRVGEAREAFGRMPYRTTTAYTALINGYIKNGDVESARVLFDDPAVEKNVVTWTAMISGYNKIGRFREALHVFVRMIRVPVNPNPFTYSAALTCAAGLASLAIGASIHARILKHCPPSDPAVTTSLVEMYGRCADADASARAFDGSEPETRTIATWNAAIGSFGMNGRSDEAVQLFYLILTEGNGIRPDRVTFVNLLTACAHGGLVREGERVWETMEREFGIERGIEHYGCLIDLYGRAGMAEEAARVVAEMPVAADAAAVGAAGRGLGLERRIRVCGERGEWGMVGELKEERERVVGRKKGRGVSWVECKSG